MRGFYNEVMEEYEKFIEKYPECEFIYENEDNAVYNCVKCNQETLNFYVYCDPCSRQKKSNDDPILICLQCYEAHLKECRTPDEIFYYYKLSPELVQKLISKLMKLDTIEKEHPSLNHWVNKSKRQDKKEKLKASRSLESQGAQNMEIEKPKPRQEIKLKTKICSRKEKKVAQNGGSRMMSPNQSPESHKKTFKILKKSQKSEPSKTVLKEEGVAEKVKPKSLSKEKGSLNGPRTGEEIDDRDYRIRKKLKADGEGESEDAGKFVSKELSISMSQSIRQLQVGNTGSMLAGPLTKTSFEKTGKTGQSDYSSNEMFFLGKLMQN